MRVPNYYAAPGYERAGLRRRETSWIIERIADPATLFVPIWRNHNLIIEIEAAADEVDYLIAQMEIDGDLGIGGEKIRQGRGHVQQAKGHRCGYPNASSRCR